MPRMKKNQDGAVATALAKATTTAAAKDVLDGLDYTIEKGANGRWEAQCLGVTAYGTSKKQALFMLVEELNGFKGGEATAPTPSLTVPPSVVVGLMNQTPAPTTNKGEAYSIEDAELIWGIEFPGKPDLLRQLFLERIQLKERMDADKKRTDEINKALLGFYSRQGVESVKWEDWTISRVASSRSTLNKEALVLAGVKAELIAQCTERTEFVMLKLTGPKGD